MITNPKRTPETIAAAEWILEVEAAGHRFLVPAIADYEVRRELLRAGKLIGLDRLDAFNSAEAYRFVSVTDSALRLGADLLARVRNAGAPTSGLKELDADVLIGAQVLDMGMQNSDFVLATVNVGHLSRFAPARLWTTITP